ncbi:helix-turn-helix domain-containing protein [Actinomadura nitritigenes]|uniref:helix-turn-helix domain-containing protein n=1 Tax=Actinomadura nitritigenes TaxID=134602 RepID=UPI00368BB878
MRELAAHAGVSVRHLTRLLRSELESSPAEYVAFVRFSVARDSLEAGRTVTETAGVAGYGSYEAMRRAFVTRLHSWPTERVPCPARKPDFERDTIADNARSGRCATDEEGVPWTGRNGPPIPAKPGPEARGPSGRGSRPCSAAVRS